MWRAATAIARVASICAPPQPIEYQPFDPETVLDAELGAKADWFIGDWRMRTNVAVYHQWYDDIQRTVAVTNPVGVPGSAVQNAAKAKVFGVELEQTIAPTDNLSLQINYAYTDPKYDEWTEPATGADLSEQRRSTSRLSIRVARS